MKATLFDQREKKILIGMVHCDALLGAVNFSGSMETVIENALRDAMTLEQGGVSAILVENFSDRPIDRVLSLEQVCAFSAVVQAISKQIHIPFGVAASFCDWRAAIAIAAATGGSFIRCPVFTDTVVTACGLIEPCASELIRYRKALRAEHIAVLADVQVKYSHALVDGISVEEAAVSAAMSGADGLIVTGSHTGGKTPTQEIVQVKRCVEIPVLIGSGFSEERIGEQLGIADGAIVGSAFKLDGKAENHVCFQRTSALMKKVRSEWMCV